MEDDAGIAPKAGQAVVTSIGNRSKPALEINSTHRTAFFFILILVLAGGGRRKHFPRPDGDLHVAYNPSDHNDDYEYLDRVHDGWTDGFIAIGKPREDRHSPAGRPCLSFQ